MIIEKFLNNNMLLVNDNHEEMIVMGKGLRFHYKVGDEIRDEDIEKTYVLQDSTNKNGYLQVLENAPDIYLEIVHHIIEMAQLKNFFSIQQTNLCDLVRSLVICGRKI